MSKNIYDVIKVGRSGAKVRRFHTVDLLVHETVGHHSNNVAFLCAVLSNYRPSAELLMTALVHDYAEQFTGDVPAHAKWASDELKTALDRFELQFEFLPHAIMSSEEAHILKQADMLDLCFKCLEELQMGNQTVAPILDRGLGYLLANKPSPITLTLIQEIQNERK